MIPTYRVVGMLLLTTLIACAEKRHPIDEQLLQLRPVTIASLTGLAWPAGTLLCPLTPYMSLLPDTAPEAARVNAFLKRKQFKGADNHWSLVVVKPTPVGDDAIEQLIFKNAGYEVVTSARVLKQSADEVPAGFTLQACVPVEHARVLVTRGAVSHQTFISFGTE